MSAMNCSVINPWSGRMATTSFAFISSTNDNVMEMKVDVAVVASWSRRLISFRSTAERSTTTTGAFSVVKVVFAVRVK